jgi:sirohydrochlorin ferrochelatase
VAEESPGQKKTAVLLVSHGSHSAQWRKMLTDVEQDVSERVLAIPGIDGLKSAFMEYTEPSIATQLKALDDEGYTHVILVPLLLTVSSHSFDDIPTIIGAKDDAKSLAMLEAERIERYLPRAQVTITPLLDFPSLLETNLIRRVGRLTREPADEGVVLVAYGDTDYNDEWVALFSEVGEKLKAGTGIAMVTHAWCGHIAGYKKQPTVDAIQSVLADHERAIVVPVLVAYDETFQGKIIGGAVDEVGIPERVVYTPDAILPEPELNEWIVSISRQTQETLGTNAKKGPQP